ncbi:Uncharacterised protein [uncultured archaeon]|nr:Uncharacterised protein [uncultured archaeon]
MMQNFTILWIEDKEIVITSQVPDIKRFLEKEGFQLNLLIDNEGERFKEYLNNEPIDIIVTDYNISETVKGIDVVDYVREKKMLNDILFYSVHDDLFEDGAIYTKLGHYGLVEVCEGKEVTEPLKNLIKKNIIRCQDIVFLRGFVISRSIELELKLNEFLARYFKIPEKQLEEFHNTILESSYVPMAGKKKWLSQILEKNGIKKEPEFEGLLNKLPEQIDFSPLHSSIVHSQ